MTHTDSSCEEPAMTERVSVKELNFSRHLSHGTSEILASMFMHDLSLKQSSVTELNLQKLFIHRYVFWRRENSLCKYLNAGKMRAL